MDEGANNEIGKIKKTFALDWEKLLNDGDDAEEQQLPVVSGQTESVGMGSTGEEVKRLSDKLIMDKMQRLHNTVSTTAHILHDKGEKLRDSLQICADELDHRRRLREQEGENISDDTTQASQSNSGGSSSLSKEKSPSSCVPPQSRFAARFTDHLEEDSRKKSCDPFRKEMSLLGRREKRKIKENGQSSQKGRQKYGPLPFQCASSVSRLTDNDKIILLNDESQVRRDSSANSVPHSKDNFIRGRDEMVNSLHYQTSTRLRPRNMALKLKPAASSFNFLKVINGRPFPGLEFRGQAVVLLDEEDAQLLRKVEKLPECFKDATIYYPSRDDPESVTVSYLDTECLAPEAFLNSAIMNFYIRYLQQITSVANRGRSNYHFFNTYFYEKLKDAVSYKGNDKGPFFAKFRRWWKGVNIFQKAYILIPVHEEQHWSLVIICILDKQDESGPIILHLDSLGLHRSRKIFDNIKSFLTQEYDYVRREFSLSDIPISERIWKNLPRRIDDKVIGVPQQKNEYDCGLFVLFFMERFIEEAPERLKRTNLSMFSKQWFRPEEASNLRGKVRDLLLEEFKRANGD